MSATTVPLLIVGGGIGGLSAALGLALRGRPVHVLERAREFGEIGAGIQIAPNASRVLAELGVYEAIRACAVFPARIVWMDMISGRRLTHLDLGPAFIERYGYPYVVMHRRDLLEALLDACIKHPAIALENDRSVEAIVDRGDGMAAICSNGAEYHAEALVCADGLWSTGRKLLDPIELPQYDRFIAYRGAIPIERISEHAGLDNVIVWSGPNRHFIQYPVRRGELFNQVAVFRSPSASANVDDWGSSAELDAEYAGVCELVQAGLREIQRDRRWVMADRPPLERWSVNRMTLLGDAAHPMYQYAAQGACQAIEDASVLAESVAQNASIPAAFAAYEAKRILRTAQVQRTARWFGEVMHLSGAGAVFRNMILARRAPDDYEPFDYLYAYGTERGAAARTIDDLR
jgi:salicylate hydroxylase